MIVLKTLTALMLFSIPMDFDRPAVDLCSEAHVLIETGCYSTEAAARIIAKSCTS